MNFIMKYLKSFIGAQRIQHNHKKYGTKLNCNYNMDTDIVWIDLEMTGLNVDKDKIIEIACLITDSNLQIKSSDFHTIIHQSDELINGMDEWCKQTHGKSGLIDAIRKSNVTMIDAEEQLLNFIMEYVKQEKTCPLAGNSIYMDRLFIKKLMPRIDDYLHYRIIDVSSIKELARRWYPNVAENMPKKKLAHRAIDDIKESITELKYYRSNIFKNL
ncbi:hypothetical protein PV327_010808 [Microctonus hyperodae]|uniref:Probable oligoribonuclease n=1 Tax=Microctonus hyperodae TaxID=165561 RepID=A0AA39C8F3_MICHY|nr:hypothetical protein PV327_010808 [Microctonus hyperodae]